MPTYMPTDSPLIPPPTTETPTLLEPPTQTPTVSHSPTASQERPPDEAVEAIVEGIGDTVVIREEEVNDDNETIVVEKKFSTADRLENLLLLSEHPSGKKWPSYLYTYRDFETALKKMTSGVGPGERNFFYVGDGSDNSANYGYANIAAFLAQAVTQSIYNDTCDEISYEMVDSRYPISNSCGQEGRSYQDEKCEGGDKGMECEVDPTMEVHGATHARWFGAPPPMYCGDRSVGYWDHERVSVVCRATI